MSTLDQAFIKAYTKKPGSAVPGAEQTTCAVSEAERRLLNHTAPPQVGDELWAQGKWYRCEPPENAAPGQPRRQHQRSFSDSIAESEAEEEKCHPGQLSDGNEQGELTQNGELSGWVATAKATSSETCPAVAEYACSKSTDATWVEQAFIESTLSGFDEVAGCLVQCDFQTGFPGNHQAAVAATDEHESLSSIPAADEASETVKKTAEVAKVELSSHRRTGDEQSAVLTESATATPDERDGGSPGDQPSPLPTEVPAAAGPAASPGVASAAGDWETHHAPGSPADPAADSRISDGGDGIECQWEVDQFFWPAICDQLYERQAAYFDEAGRRLRDAAGDGANVLGITSIAGGEGKSTLALSLARCAVQAGVRVALVDADWQHPELGQLLGLDDTCSWSQAISGELPLAECGVVSHEDRLSVFPLKPGHAGDFATHRQRINELLHTLARQYELVVLDMGTLDSHAVRMCEDGENPTTAVILVCDLRQDQEATEDAVARIQAGGIEAVGIVENFVKASL